MILIVISFCYYDVIILIILFAHMATKSSLCNELAVFKIYIQLLNFTFFVLNLVIIVFVYDGYHGFLKKKKKKKKKN
jgi:hypothetical protein